MLKSATGSKGGLTREEEAALLSELGQLPQWEQTVRMPRLGQIIKLSRSKLKSILWSSKTETKSNFLNRSKECLLRRGFQSSQTGSNLCRSALKRYKPVLSKGTRPATIVKFKQERRKLSSRLRGYKRKWRGEKSEELRSRHSKRQKLLQMLKLGQT